jgi:lipopolysaccharide biosynthesis regulator YciM
MPSTTEFETSLLAARNLQKDGKFPEAEQAYRQIAAEGGHRETLLRALFGLYLQSRQLHKAIETLIALIKEVPESLTYHADLANLLQSVGQPEVAVGFYERLLKTGTAV